MKVHWCPHCRKPFLPDEARDGNCPVCHERVSEDVAPAPAPSPSPAERALRSESPRPSSHSSTPAFFFLLLLTVLLWWLHARELHARNQALARELQAARGEPQAARNKPADRPTTNRVATRPPAPPAPAPVPDPALPQPDLAEQMRGALAVLKADPGHHPSQATLAAGMTRDPAWIPEIVALTPPPTWAAAPLIAMVEHQDPATRRRAAEGLDKLGSADPITQAVLDRATRDRDPDVRRAAEAALRKIRSGQTN